MRAPLILALVTTIATAAAAQGGPILAPVVVDDGTWRGTFTLAQPTSNLRIRYSSGHCVTGRDFARTILNVRGGPANYGNTWMAVQQSRGGPVEAQSHTPPFALPAGTYEISVEAKSNTGKAHKIAVCVGEGDACAAFEKLAPAAC